MLDQSKTAFLFPGQGSQAVGMVAALAAEYHVARQTLEEADDILGFALSALMVEGPDNSLTDTINAQPALYTAGIAALRTLYEAIEQPFQPAYVAGHSLGELTALTAAGAMSFPEGLRLVRRRGELMKEADTYSPGGMAAILGLDAAQLTAICAEARAAAGGVVVVANDNCPGQVVLAGDEQALASAMERAGAAGAKKVVRLPISIAAHSPLMARAQEEFRKALDATNFQPPVLPIIGNTQAIPLNTAAAVRDELSAQLTSPVRWTESVQAMLDAGITTFVELGSKDVLVGLVKRISRETARYVVDVPAGVEAVANNVRESQP